MVVITEENRDIILGAVRRMYTDLAREPERGSHFPTGRGACEFEGYPDELLDRIPSEALASFAGVNYPFRANVIEEGDTVREVARVLRPGGAVQVSDIVLARTPSEACRSQPELWAECIVGATREDEYLELFESAGFQAIEPLAKLDYFAHGPSDETRDVATSFGARSIVFRARRGA